MFCTFFFFFFFEFRPKSGRFGRYRPIRQIPADTDRVGPIWVASAPMSAPILATSARVGPIRDSPRGTTRHGRAVCGVPPASPRPAASDAGALAWEPRPCIPVKIQLNSQPTFFSFGCLEAMSHFLGQNYIFCNAGHKGHL